MGDTMVMREMSLSLLPGNRKMYSPLALKGDPSSPLMGETVVRQAFGLGTDARDCEMQTGELALSDSFGKSLPLSVVLRLKR